MNIAIIPARGGSKRIPRKNIKPFFGRPIMAYSINAALESALFDIVVVSTEDLEIGSKAASLGAQWLPRRPELAEIGAPDCGTQEVARAALVDLMPAILEHLYPKNAPCYSDFACVIYPTAPLISVEDLRYGRRLLHSYPAAQFSMAVGAKPLRDAGQWYWGRINAFMARMPLISPRTLMVPIEESRVCDINTEQDWKHAEQMYAENKSFNDEQTKNASAPVPLARV